MKFLAPLLVWLVMGAVLTAGILMAVYGKGLWLFILGSVGFIVLSGKYGCMSH